MKQKAVKFIRCGLFFLFYLLYIRLIKQPTEQRELTDGDQRIKVLTLYVEKPLTTLSEMTGSSFRAGLFQITGKLYICVLCVNVSVLTSS